MSQQPRELPGLDAGEVSDAADRARGLAKALDGLAKALEPLQPARASKALARAQEAAEVGPSEVLAAVGRGLAAEAAERGPRLSAELRRRCEAEGIGLAVVTRQPLELRLPPLGVSVDLERDRADLTFGRERLARVGARADEILAARAEALAELEEGEWDPRAYLFDLYRAWRRCSPRGDWVELVDALPELVLLRQGEAWRREPSARNFRPYSRARFAYDLHRLRRDRALAIDGWRLSLGPATGGSTADKKRVLWLEDAQGRGQYHLTLRFTREGA